MKKLALLFLAVAAQAGTLTYQSAPLLNPDKGLFPFYFRSAVDKARFPYTLTWGSFSLRSVMTGPATYDWSEVERILNAVSSNGCRAVLRPYGDYPGNEVDSLGVTTNGWPDFFFANVTMSTYTNFDNGVGGQTHMSYSPDYEDADCQTYLTNFVAAFGAQYNGDARIACIQLGLIGFWGEWHTECNTRGDPACPQFASTNFQAQLISAYTNAFPNTRLQARYAIGPSSTATFKDMWTVNDVFPLGQGDQSFTFDTFGVSWYTLEMQQASGALWTNHWKSQVFGGEVYPSKQYCIWSDSPCVDGAQTFDACVSELHASWMLANGLFSAVNPVNTNAAVRARAIASAQGMGYELFAREWSASSTVVSVVLTNTGVAPFYYDWPISVRAISGTTTNTFVTNWKLTQVVPGDGAVTNSVTLTNLAKGTWALSMKATNPLTNGYPLCFANATQDTNTGWLALGNLDWLEVTHRVSGGVTMSGGVRVQ